MAYFSNLTQSLPALPPLRPPRLPLRLRLRRVSDLMRSDSARVVLPA
jgi:hypothetical protein